MRNSERRLIISAAIVAALLLVPGMATASHNDLYYTEIGSQGRADPGFGRTTEPDSATARTPGTPELDGLESRNSFPGAPPGSGGLFLDARIGHRATATSAGMNMVYTEAFAADITGRSDIIIPGPHATAAWYGWWQDLNGDGVIDDYPEEDGSGDDEFKWRGRASGEEIPMLHYVYPRTQNRVLAMNNIGLFGTAVDTYSKENFEDFTNTDHRAWIATGGASGGSWSVNGPYDSLLVTMTHVTVANPGLNGPNFGLDFNAPGTLVDVDVYRAVSPEVGDLYVSVMQAAAPTIRDVLDVPNTAYDEFFYTLNDITETLLSDPMTPINDEIYPRHAKEPNHVLDDYGGHAFFGGVGDTFGSFNVYPGYQAGDPHLFVDAQARTKLAYGNVDNGFQHEPSPSLRDDPHKRQAGVVFGIKAMMLGWVDKNLDGHFGVICDPQDPQEWDAERGTCKYLPYPHEKVESGGESKGGLCGITAKDPIMVRPVDGNWPGVVVLRNQGDYDLIANDVEGSFDVRVDNEPIFLDWWPCGSSEASTADVILFPAGNPTVTIQTIWTVTSPSWVDRDGIQHPSETVTDVDIYYPIL